MRKILSDFVTFHGYSTREDENVPLFLSKVNEHIHFGGFASWFGGIRKSIHCVATLGIIRHEL